MVRALLRLFVHSQHIRRMHSAEMINPSPSHDVSRKVIKLRDYDCVGFDLDHTLAEYNLQHLYQTCYNAMTDFLVKEKGYPEDGFSNTGLNFCARGLLLDLEKGNFMKVSDTGYILRASHGSRMLNEEEIAKEFGAERKWIQYERLVKTVNNIDDRYRIFDNLFDMPTGIVCAHAIDCLSRKKGWSEQSGFNVWPDVLDAINWSYHPKQFAADDGGFFPAFKKNPELFINRLSNEMKTWLRNLKNDNKKLFIITSSYIDFAKLSLQHILGVVFGSSIETRFMNVCREDWESYFDINISFARKPSFFSGSRQFLELDENGKEVPVSELKSGGFYLEGNGVEFTKFLSKITGVEKPKVLYVGDSMRSDIFPAKTVSGWDTILVLDELKCSDCINVNAVDKFRVNADDDDSEPQAKKSKSSSSEVLESSGKASDDSQRHFLDSEDWGSLFMETVSPSSHQIKATSEGSEELSEERRKGIKSLWCDVIYKYTDVIVPSVDSLSDVNFDDSIPVLSKDVTSPDGPSATDGFHSRVPCVLIQKQSQS